MDVVLDNNIVQFIRGQFLDPPDEETLSLQELQRSSQNVNWQKPNYEEIGCRILDTYFSPSSVVACSEGCNKTIPSKNNINGGGYFMPEQHPCKCEISNAFVDSVKNQLVVEMRSMKVRLTKLDERLIFDGTSMEKSLKVGDNRSIGLQNAQIISTDSTYETIQEPGQEQVLSQIVPSIQLSDCGRNDFDDQQSSDCSVIFLEHLTHSKASLKNSTRIARTKSREKKAKPALVSSSALNKQITTKTTPSMTNSGAKASPTQNVVGLANNNLGKASKLDQAVASTFRPSRSRKKISQASKTKKIESGRSQVRPNGDGTIHENLQNCTVSIENCKIPTSEEVQCQDILSITDSGLLSKHNYVTSQSSAAVAEVPSPKQNLSEAGCETSRFGRTIKKVKLTSYDATPAYIIALQQRQASFMIENGQRRNLNKTSYDKKGCKDQHPNRLSVGKDGSASDDSGSDESYWLGKDVPKQKKCTQKLNATKRIKKVSTVNSKINIEPKQKKRTTSSKVLHEMGPPKVTVDKTSRVAKLKNGRAPLKKSNFVDGEALRLSNSIDSNLSNCKNGGYSIHHTAESNGTEDLEEQTSTHWVASKTKQKSSTVEKKHVDKAKRKAIGRNKADLKNVSPLSEIACQTKNKKLCEAKDKEPQDLQRGREPCKVTAKKGTLTHLKQRQKQQEHIRHKLQEVERCNDFFDDLDDPQIGNFHKAKYQINSKFLNSPVTGDSTAFASFNSSCSSFVQTPTTSKNVKKRNGKKQIGIPSNASCNVETAFTPRSALLARFAGDETNGRGWMVNTPTTADKGGNLGVNLGLAVTPGELLERNVANHIIYNNKMKRAPKRPSGATALNQSVVGHALSGGSSQSGGPNASSRSLPDGSLGQSPDTSLRTGRLKQVAVEYEYSPAGPKKLKRLKLPSILDDVASQDEEGGNHDDYFEDCDN